MALSDFVWCHLQTMKLLHISSPIMEPSERARFRARFLSTEYEHMGTKFHLAAFSWKGVLDTAFEDEYWEQRLRRPQDLDKLSALAVCAT